ncbi:8569_t:CDS:2 [Dentiscutata erythropus]|uniref:8569_t:CDS:1 n=1 Tax=Dentiscutata erythropus TaxID=1348616 RepID=A0A9N9AVK3_9GLOM|nr:8569_t:CDS:2 [Dentiscutata erythropus]
MRLSTIENEKHDKLIKNEANSAKELKNLGAENEFIISNLDMQVKNLKNGDYKELKRIFKDLNIENENLANIQFEQ